MKRIILGSMFLISLSAQASTINTMKPVSEFQNDAWSCGVHSTYRSLHNFDMADSYGNLKSFIGQQEFKYDFSKEITETVNENVCEWLGPFKHLCKEVTKIVTRISIIKIPMKLGIGRSPPQLAGKISAYGVHSVASEKVDFPTIEGLVDKNQPVLTLLQVDVVGDGLISYPLLHWIVVNGYDDRSIYYYDTDSNKQNSMNRGEFYKQWDWNNGWNKRNSPVHLHLTRNEGLEVRSIVNFSDEKIDRIILLEDLEARAGARLDSVMETLASHLSNQKIKEVTRRANAIESTRQNLEQKASDTLNLIGTIIQE